MAVMAVIKIMEDQMTIYKLNWTGCLGDLDMVVLKGIPTIITEHNQEMDKGQMIMVKQPISIQTRNITTTMMSTIPSQAIIRQAMVMMAGTQEEQEHRKTVEELDVGLGKQTKTQIIIQPTKVHPVQVQIKTLTKELLTTITRALFPAYWESSRA